MVSISTIVLYKDTCRTLGLNPVICFFQCIMAIQWLNQFGVNENNVVDDDNDFNVMAVVMKMLGLH